MAEPFKNIYNEQFVKELAQTIYTYDNTFQDELFVNNIMKNLHTLELKERMRHISTSMDEYWDKPFTHKVTILLKVKNNLQKNKNFVLASMVFPDFIEVFGLNDYDTSIEALEHFTIDSSSEFAIRPFILQHEEQTMKQMKKWAAHENEHVRRLATEGCRPRLPWAIALPCFKKNPSKVFEILEILKNDKSMYVRKSVANNLNDISKDNPKLVVNFIKNHIGKDKNLDWILKHGARTLLKASNAQTLMLFGFSNTNLQLKDLQYKNSISIGEDLPFSFNISSDKNLGKIRLEYAIDLVRKNGKKTQKIFQISSGNYTSKLKQIITKHSFKKVTTRNYYVGLHKLYILANGKELASFEFDLKEE